MPSTDPVPPKKKKKKGNGKSVEANNKRRNKELRSVLPKGDSNPNDFMGKMC